MSIVDTGLPVVFVSAKSLDIPLSTLLEHPASIDANIDLMAKLEQVRQRACSLFPALRSILSPPSPKLCIVHPRCNYTTTGGEILSKGSMDLMIRTVSTGVRVIACILCVCVFPRRISRLTVSFFGSNFIILFLLQPLLRLPHQCLSGTVSSRKSYRKHTPVRRQGKH